MLLLGDCNAKSKSWFIIDQSSSQEVKLESLTLLYGMKQLISESTHGLENSSSCIDFISYEPTKVGNGSWSSSLSPFEMLYENEVICAELNLKKECPPPYTCKVWDYGTAQFNMINRAIINFDWNELISGQDIHNEVNFFNTII